MLKFLGTFGVLTFSIAITRAQNLVPNPGFDTYTNCVTTSSQYDLTPPWVIPANQSGSPDYMHACYSGGDDGNGTPENFYGYQTPRSGKGYYGIITYYDLQEVREYLTVRLNERLEKDEEYIVGFYVSQAETFPYVTDHFGAYLSEEPPVGNGDYTAINYIPQIENGEGNIIKEADEWVLISGRYKAKGNERYITIGNFYDDDHTQVEKLNNNGDYSHGYYYLDDVFVIKATDSSAFFKGQPVEQTKEEEYINLKLASVADLTAANSEYHGDRYVPLREQLIHLDVRIDKGYRNMSVTSDKAIELIQLELRNPRGELVATVDFNGMLTMYLADIGHLEEGLYFVKIISKTRKFPEFQMRIDR